MDNRLPSALFGGIMIIMSLFIVAGWTPGQGSLHLQAAPSSLCAGQLHSPGSYSQHHSHWTCAWRRKLPGSRKSVCLVVICFIDWFNRIVVVHSLQRCIYFFCQSKLWQYFKEGFYHNTGKLNFQLQSSIFWKVVEHLQRKGCER